MKTKLSDFVFIMISAMYENGGNTTHRLLDGHPELFVYPFESQLGTKYVNDFLSSLYPLKYRWPVFPSHASASEIYELIIDEEAKVRLKTPFVSKFRESPMNLTDVRRKEHFLKHLDGKELSRANVIQAFFRATFSAWNDYKKTGKEKAYVGYSPIIGIDGDKIIEEFKGSAYVIHVVRNPWSAYADTLKRAVPLSIPHYMTGWCTSQYFAKLFSKKNPNHFFTIRFEDIVKDKQETLSNLLATMGIGASEALGKPSWNGAILNEVYPWGTVRTPTEEQNLKTAKELSQEQIQEIYLRTESYVHEFGYQDFYKSLSGRKKSAFKEALQGTF